MAKDDRSAINPFTNKKHLDFIDDDEFLQQSYNEYYRIINNSQLLDDTEQGILVKKIANDLINAVEEFLAKIGRSDYTEDYYDWEFHLIGDNTVNAWCMPGGKIVMYSGMLGPAESKDDLALILGHEMAHALLDHSRTQASARKAKNTITTAAWIGSLGLSLFGMGELGALTRAATNVADIGSEFLVMKPFGRDHEFEADKLGMMIMHWAGYDIRNVPDFWSRVSANNQSQFDFFSTHPADSKRIDTMQQLIIEIEGGKDFYATPVLGTGNLSNTTTENLIPCSNCGKLIEKNSLFCTNCGIELNKISAEDSTPNKESKIICSSCGNSINADSLFCTYCGVSLDVPSDGVVLESSVDSNIQICCKNCGKLLNEEDKFCTGCGTPVNDSVNLNVCPNCGKLFKDDDKFCTGCGTKL